MNFKIAIVLAFNAVAAFLLPLECFAQRGGGHAGGGAGRAPGGAGGHPGGNGMAHSGGGPGGPPGRSGGGMGGGLGGGLSGPQSHERGGANPGGASPFGAGNERNMNGAGNRPGMGNESRGGERTGGERTGGERGGGQGTGPGGASTVARPGVGQRTGAGGGQPGGSTSVAKTRPGANQSNNTASSGSATTPPPTTGTTGTPSTSNVASSTNNRGNVNPNAALAYGTRYRSQNMMDEQALAVRARNDQYQAYNAGRMAGYTSAWVPTNLTNASLYSSPGYGALAAGLKLGQQPMPYDYGGNVVTQGNTVYVNGDAQGSPEQYAQQASQIAANGAATPVPETSKWLPLGVFALVEGDATQSNDVFQLAVNPQGVLRGNYHNLADDSMEAITGSVDRTSQKAAWVIGNDKLPVYEAGIVNLTKDSTPLLLHLPDGGLRQMTLIRLEKPAN